MLGTRLVSTDRFVLRPRLLERLPDAHGYVVCLEAPYGYGKSVLAAHWAQRLAGEGWRVVWAAPAGRSVRETLAGALDVPASAPWGVVLDAVWAVPSLVVLEDLEGTEDLDPLLRRVDGLVALASRGPLPSPELPRWATWNRLVRVTAADLAFRAEEAGALFDRSDQAEAAWRRTGGWPLPLHFAALTGEVPDPEAMAEGVRGSVANAAWREALLIASLDVLPADLASDATHALAAAGFVQTLDAGYRLHPLVAEAALARHPDEARSAVIELAARLPPLLRGRAYLRSGHDAGLRDLLDATEDETYRAHPDTFLAWHARVGPPVGTVRRCHAAIARMLAGDVDGGVQEARPIADDPGIAPRWRVRAAVAALFALAQSGRLAEAEPFAQVADRHAGDLPEFDRARVAQTRMVLAHYLGRPDEAERHLEAARTTLARAAADPRYLEARAIFTRNVAYLRWMASGSSTPQRLAIREVLTDAAAARAAGRPSGLTAVTLGGLVGMLATFDAMAGDTDAVAELSARWRDALPGPDGFALEIVRARIDHDLAALSRVHAEALRWERADVADAAAAAAAAVRRLRGEPPRSTPGASAPTGPLSRLQHAIDTAAAGDAAAGRAALGDPPTGDRTMLLTWLAAAFQTTGDPAHLDALRAASDLGDAPLPYLGVPLARLPRDRPEAARAYPLPEVLGSGWEAAIALREPEVPDLELRLLGAVEARVLGRQVELTTRQRELLALLALGAGREAVGVALWPDLDAPKVRNNLNVLLSGLRRALQPWGIATYLGDGGLARTRRDLDDLEAALAGGDVPAVVRTYRGRLGAGLDVPTLDEAASELEARVYGFLRRSAAASEPEDAIALHEALLRIDPWDVDVWSALFDTLHALGRRGEAQRRLAAWAARWERDMGLPLPDEIASRLAR